MCACAQEGKFSSVYWGCGLDLNVSQFLPVDLLEAADVAIEIQGGEAAAAEKGKVRAGDPARIDLG